VTVTEITTSEHFRLDAKGALIEPKNRMVESAAAGGGRYASDDEKSTRHGRHGRAQRSAHAEVTRSESRRSRTWHQVAVRQCFFCNSAPAPSSMW
jgi:uncharacterized protein (DUF2345 family)